MAIQFLDVGGTKKILFDGGSVAMNAACCCEPGPLTQCCAGGFPDSFSVTASGISNAGVDNWCCGSLNGTNVADYDESTLGWAWYDWEYFCYPNMLLAWIIVRIQCDTANRVINIHVTLRAEYVPSALSHDAYYTISIPITDDGSTNCSTLLSNVTIDKDSESCPQSTCPWCKGWPASITISGIYT